jgi:hypothetical protein
MVKRPDALMLRFGNFVILKFGFVSDFDIIISNLITGQKDGKTIHSY